MTEKPEFVDVLVVGAGLAGIGSACQLRRNMPQLSLAILEARPVSGGTWDLFRYPGIRSDSDMYTYSYGFKPWTAKSAIADGDTILKYIRETAEEFGLNRHIRYNHKVVSASWSSQDNLWTVTIARTSMCTLRLRRAANHPEPIYSQLHRLLRLRAGIYP